MNEALKEHSKSPGVGKVQLTENIRGLWVG